MSSLPAFAAPQALIVDTDLGIDDFIALAYLLENPKVDIKAITVECDGITHCQASLPQLADFLAFLDKSSITVGTGGFKPLSKPPKFIAQRIIEINETLAGTPIPVAKHPSQFGKALPLLEKTLAAQEKPIDILALGPLTNLAELFQKRPDLKAKIKRIYIMGGALFVPGNIDDLQVDNSSKAEWNIYFDARAADLVFKSGVPITLIPLDLTQQAPLTLGFDKQLNKKNKPVAQFFAEMLAHNRQAQPGGVWYFWDPLAAVIATKPSLAQCKSYPLKIELRLNKDYGATLVDKAQGAETEVCTHMDLEGFQQALIGIIGEH